MEKLNELLKAMDFDFLGSGKHGMSVEGMRKALGDGQYLFLDVRTRRELEYLILPFATHIPLNELPDRLEELPRDKTVVAFCSSIFRGGVAYAYLRANGFEAKAMTASLEEMIAILKPGPLAKM